MKSALGLSSPDHPWGHFYSSPGNQWWRRQWHPYSSTLAWKNPMDGGDWWAAVHGVAKCQTWLSDFTFTFQFHTLEKEMATHSSFLAWRIPGMGEPGGLPSMGLHRVGHYWSNLAAAAAETNEGNILSWIFKIISSIKCRDTAWEELLICVITLAWLHFSCISYSHHCHHDHYRVRPLKSTLGKMWWLVLWV